MTFICKTELTENSPDWEIFMKIVDAISESGQLDVKPNELSPKYCEKWLVEIILSASKFSTSNESVKLSSAQMNSFLQGKVECFFFM